MAATALAFDPQMAKADNLPTGGNITAGLGNISQNGAVMTVQQNTSKMIVDWKGFSIGADHTVNFVQPSSSSVALNRVTGADPSVIQGHLNANGQIFLLNPNGVLFTPTAQVNVGGIIASTLALSDADFLAANYKFEGSSSNAIVNQGNLVAGKDSAGGDIVMIAAKITNEGAMDANGGAVVLGAGSKVTLDLGGPVKLSIESGALEALIQNGGAIRSEGGTILLTAQAADALSRTVIKNTGVIEAQTLSTGPNGEIILKAGPADRIEVGGTLDASAPNGGDGGFVETSAGQIDFANDLRVTTTASRGLIGTWLIDPQIIEIYAGTPGTRVDTTYISTSVLNTNLTSSDVSLNATDWIDFTTSFSYTGGRSAILSLYSPVVKLGGNISSTTTKLGLNFGGTYSSTNYKGDLYVYGGSRSITTNGGDVNFYGNIGGGATNSLSVDTKTGAGTPGTITHHDNVNGTFNVTTVTNQLLSVTFTAGNKANVILDCTTATLTVNGVVTPLGSGFIPLGHINFPAGTVVSLNASDSGTDTVTITKLGGTITTIKPAPNGNITIPAGGLEITKIAYLTKSANAQSLGTNVNVDIYNTTNAGKLSNYTAVGGTYTIDALKSVSVAGDIRISTSRFLNNANGTALVAGTGKTWEVWSSNADPFNVSTGDVRNGLDYNFKQYNATYGVTTVIGAGNGFLYTYAPKISFSLVNNLTKVYDATDTATGLTGHYLPSGAVDGDTIGESGSIPLPTSGLYASKNVGTNINVSVSGISASSILAYNTSLSKSVYGYGLQSTTASGTIGTITKANISAITGITANNKAYDTFTTATLNTGSAAFTGRLGSDILTVATSTGAFLNENVGTGKTVNITGLSLGGADAGNYNLLSTTATTSANITKANITAITGITANSKIYDSFTTATLNIGSVGFTGLLSGDVLTLAAYTGAFADKNVGTGKTVNISGLTLGGTDAGNYNLVTTTASALANITKADISSITGITANNKTYNSDVNATLNTASAVFNGKFTGDVLSVATSSGAFSEPHVGVGKTVSITGLTLGGADAGNYNLVSTIASTTATITKADITAITGITANNKTYDGNATATLITSGAILAGEFLGDDLTVATATGAFNNKNAGTGKAVSITGLTLGGSDAVNYNLLSTTSSTTANITKLTLANITGITAVDRVYNADTNATLTLGGALFGGKISGDTLTVASATGTFANKDANLNPKTVTISSIVLGGTDAGNYNLPLVLPTTTAIISKANISAITGITASDKVYDSFTSAALNTGSAAFTGKYTGDTLTVLTSVGNFNNKNVGTNKSVSITGLSLGGTDSLNYNLISTTASTTASITKAAISAITGITANNKTYNSDPAATLNTTAAGFAGKFAGDVLNVATSTGTFVDEHAGLGWTVNITGLSLGGTDAGNYTLSNTTASAVADITKANITAITGITANSRTYDSTTDATLNVLAAGFTGAIAGDNLTVLTSVGTFNTKNVGTNKPVSITGLSLGGTDAVNYNLLTTTASTTANITKANISSITDIRALNKVYDGGATATLNVAPAVFVGKFTGDNLVVATSTGTFRSTPVTDPIGANAGNGKTVDITALTLGGADAGNYNLLINTATASADITPLSVGNPVSGITGITANNKTYDTFTTATLNLSAAAIPGILAGDVGNVTIDTSTTTADFSDRFVGVGKLVSIEGLKLGGSASGNYTLLNDCASATANITKKDITDIQNITAYNKTYDSFTTAALNVGLASFTGRLGSDTLTVATSTGNFDTKNVGTGKTVNITGLSLGGADASNYNLVSPIASTTADITKANISAITGITANNKVYNGNDGATLNTSVAGFTGIIGSDVLNVATSTGTFNNKNVGTGKAVNISSLTLGGTDAGNYNLLINTATATADITKANISSITGITAQNKVYNSDVDALLDTGAAIFAGIQGSDTLTVATSNGTFTGGPHVGNGKTVAITGLSLGGTEAGNYNLLDTTATTTANITKATISAITGITANNKTYDTFATATLNVSSVAFTGAYAGDDLVVATSAGAFVDKNAGSGKVVNISGLTLGGADAVNYDLQSTIASTNADIFKADISAITGITANNKTYDTFTTATLNTGSASFTGKLGSDTLTVATSTGAFDNENVGVGKTVNISGLTLGGIDAGNYNLLSSTASTTANVSRATISAITDITAYNKTYDSFTTAALDTSAANFTGILGSDVLTVATSVGNFDNKNVGNGKNVTITGLSLGGAAAINYSLADTTASATADIGKASITTITNITANNKVYDTFTTATLNTGSANFTGSFAGDNLTVATSTGTFTDSHAGIGKTVAITGLSLGGTDAGNYDLVSDHASTTATISKANISAVTGITANNKVYDGNTSATLNVGAAAFTDAFAGDDLNVATASGAFTNIIIGTGKTVDITGLSLGGADAVNYNLLNTTATALADITAGDRLIDPMPFLQKDKTVPTFPVFSPALTLNGQSKISSNGLNFLLPPVEIIIGEIIAGAPPWAYLPIGLESEDPIVKKRSKNGADYVETDRKDGDSIIRSGEGATNIIVVGDGVRLELKGSSQR